MELKMDTHLRNCMVDHTREARWVTVAGEKMKQGVRYVDNKKITPKILGFPLVTLLCEDGFESVPNT